MSTADRLKGICGWIAQERASDDPDAITRWELTASNQVTIATQYSHAVVTWELEGERVGQIEVQFFGETAVRPGDIRLMYINAAMWPEGDFQVAETINDQLA